MRKSFKTSHEDPQCIEPGPPVHSVESDSTSASDCCSSLSTPSCSESRDGEEIADCDLDSSSSRYVDDGDADRSRSTTPSLDASALVADDMDRTAEHEEPVPWREVAFLLKNEELTRNHEILSLREEHEAEVASIAEERDEALQVVDELIMERNQLLEEKMNWQSKFVSAVAKKNNPYPKRRSMNSSTAPPAAENCTEPASSAADEEFRECGVVEPSKAPAQPDGQQWYHDPMQPDAPGERALAHDPDYSENPSQERPRASNPIATPDPPDSPRSKRQEELIQCKLDLRRLEQCIDDMDCTEFQLQQDLEEALETKELLQQQLDGQAEEYWYMKDVFTELADKIAAISNENADPRSRLESAIGENVMLAANHQRDKRALKSTKRELSRVTRKKRLRPPRRSRLPNLPIPDGVSLRPYQAQLVSSRRLVKEIMRQNSIYLDNFRTALCWSYGYIKRDDLAVQLAENLRRTLDRNEELEWKVWNYQHPDTLEHLWLRRGSGE